MQLIKQLKKINELSPQLDILNQHIESKKRKLSSLLGEKYEVAPNGLHDELTNYGLNYQLFSTLPKLHLPSIEQLQVQIQNKLYNQVKLNQLMSRYDEVQENAVKQLHTLLLSREIRAQLMFFDEAISGFGFQVHMRHHLAYIFWLRQSEIIHRSLLTHTELQHENTIKNDKSANLRALAYDFLPGADLDDPKTCYVKALSKAQTVYEKVDELPDVGDIMGAIPGIPLTYDKHIFTENTQIGNVFGGNQGALLNEYQVKYQKVNEELLNPEVRQSRSSDSAFAIVYFSNFGSKNFSVETARENAAALFKQFNENDIEASFESIHELLAYKLMTDFVALGDANELIEILVEQQIQCCLYEPREKVNFFKKGTKLDVLNLLNVKSCDNEDYRIKIINGASVLKEKKEQPPKQDQQLREFVFASIFSISKHRTLETVSKTLENLFGDDHVGLCTALLATVKVRELDYLIRRSYNLALFYIYQIFFCIFAYNSKQHFPYVVQEAQTVSETGQKALNYKVVDKQNNPIIFSHVETEMQYFYTFLYNQFISEIAEGEKRQEDLFLQYQTFILTYFQREFERLQIVVEILRNLQLIFLSSERCHFSIAMIMCSIFRLRSTDQSYILFQLQEFIIEAMKATGDDVKGRIKAIKFTAVTDIYQQCIKINNSDIVKTILQLFHGAKHQYKFLVTSPGVEPFVPYQTFLASIIESSRIELMYIAKHRQRCEDIQMKVQKAVSSIGNAVMSNLQAYGPGDLPTQLLSELNVLSKEICVANVLIQAVGGLQSAFGIHEDSFIRTRGLFNVESPFFDDFRRMFSEMQEENEKQLNKSESYNLGTSLESSAVEGSALGAVGGFGVGLDSVLSTSAVTGGPPQQYSDSRSFFYQDADDVQARINFTQLLCFKEFGGTSFLQTCDFFERNVGTNSAFSWVFAIPAAALAAASRGETTCPIARVASQHLRLVSDFVHQKALFHFYAGAIPALVLEIGAAKPLYHSVFSVPSELVKDRIFTIITDNLPPASSNMIRQTFLTQNALSASQSGQAQVPAIILRLIKLFSIVILLRAEAEYLEVREQKMKEWKAMLNFPYDVQFQNKPDLLSQLLVSKNYYFEVDTGRPEVIYAVQAHGEELLTLEEISGRKLTPDEIQELHQVFQVSSAFQTATKHFYVLNQLCTVAQLSQQCLAHAGGYQGLLGGVEGDQLGINRGQRLQDPVGVPSALAFAVLLQPGPTDVPEAAEAPDMLLFSNNNDRLFLEDGHFITTLDSDHSVQNDVSVKSDVGMDDGVETKECKEILERLRAHVAESVVGEQGAYHLAQSNVTVDTSLVLERRHTTKQKLYHFLVPTPTSLKWIAPLPFQQSSKLLEVLYYISVKLYNILWLAESLEACGRAQVDSFDDLRVLSALDGQVDDTGDQDSASNSWQRGVHGGTVSVIQQQQELQAKISGNLKKFRRELAVVAALKSKKERVPVTFQGVVAALGADLAAVCAAFQTNSLVSFRERINTESLSLTPLVSRLLTAHELRLLGLLTTCSRLKVDQSFNIGNAQEVLFINSRSETKDTEKRLNPKKAAQITDADLVELMAHYGPVQVINMDLLSDGAHSHVPEVTKPQQFSEVNAKQSTEFFEFYSQLLYGQEKQLVPALEQKAKQVMQLLNNSILFDDKKIKNNLQFNYFNQRNYLLSSPSLKKLLEQRSEHITDIFVANQLNQTLDTALTEAMTAQPAQVAFTDACPSHLVPLYAEINAIFNEDKGDDADIQLYQFHSFVPGQTGISTLEEQITAQIELEKENNFDFLESKALKTFYVNLVKSSFRHKQSKSFLYISNFQLFKLYSEFLSDVYSEVKNQANIQQIINQLNKYVLSQIQIKKMQVIQENQKCNMQKQSANAASNYLSKKYLSDYKSFSKEQETDIQHLSSYSQYQLKILSILVSKIYSKGLQVMLMHQSISEQYLDQLKFQYFQTSNQVIFDQNIKNLSNLFEKTQLPLFNELIHLENELYNYESLLKINALLLNREMNFQHIRINELEYQLQNCKDIQDSELSRLVILKNNLQNVNNEKQAVLRKQLTALQVHLQQLSKEEDTLKDEVKAVIKPQKKENIMSQAMKKQLQPLESLIDQQTNYQKMCVDLDQVQKQISKIDEELIKYTESTKCLQEDVERQLLQYQSVNEQLIQQLKDLKKIRQEEVARVNELQRNINGKNASQFEDTAVIEERAKKAIAAVQNSVYKQRAQLSKRQEYLRKLQKLINIYKQEEDKMIGFTGL